MLRSLRLALLVAVLAAVLAAPGQAARLVLPETMTTQHFRIHYSATAALPATPVLHQDAGNLAAILERAYTTMITDWGYPAPLDDGDGLIDVYVNDLTPTGAIGVAYSDNAGANQSSGYLHIDDEATRDEATAAHELFHLIQIGQWQPMDSYVLEGTAEWAGFRFLGFPPSVVFGSGEPVPLADTLAAPDQSLTCSGSACGLSAYEAIGYSRWHFYQYLTERYGGSAVKDLFAKAKALNDPGLTGADILVRYLADRGATLGDTFGDWSVVNLTGNYTAAGLKGTLPVAYSSTSTGVSTGALATQKVAVNHLATRYLAFTRGGGGSGPCHAATLNLTVTLPAGTGSRPFFSWAGSAPLPLAVNGTTASISVPWDTCSWAHAGYLSLPNPSSTVDAALFTVNGSITVDRTKLATSTPPAAGPYTGPTVAAPSVEEVPSIALYGPETLRISRKKRVLRLVVFSSGGGSLDAALGTLGLGTRTLRAGNNDLRFTLPKTALRTLSSLGLLTVTAVSPSGARGDSLTRKLVLTK